MKSGQNRAMQELTSVSFYTNRQNKDVSKSRITRDHSDGYKFPTYNREKVPFAAGDHLVNC